MAQARHRTRTRNIRLGTGSPIFSKPRGAWSTIPGGGYYGTKAEAKKAAQEWGSANGLDEVLIYQQGTKNQEYVKICRAKANGLFSKSRTVVVSGAGEALTIGDTIQWRDAKGNAKTGRVVKVIGQGHGTDKYEVKENPANEASILHQSGPYWVKKTKHGFELFKDGATHATGVGEAYPNLSLAVARTDYLAKREAGKKSNPGSFYDRTEYTDQFHEIGEVITSPVFGLAQITSREETNDPEKPKYVYVIVPVTKRHKKRRAVRGSGSVGRGGKIRNPGPYTILNYAGGKGAKAAAKGLNADGVRAYLKGKNLDNYTVWNEGKDVYPGLGAQSLLSYNDYLRTGKRNPSQDRFLLFSQTMQTKIGEHGPETVSGPTLYVPHGQRVEILKKSARRLLVTGAWDNKTFYGWTDDSNVGTAATYRSTHGDYPEGRRSNPEGGAVDMYESFHGKPSEEILEFVEEEHYHGNLAGLGTLVEAKIITVSGYDVTLSFESGDGKEGKENPQKWILPFKRGKKNYEDVGYLPYALEHDIGFSGRKMYRPVKQSGGSITVISSDLSRFDYDRYSRKSAIEAIKKLAAGGSQENGFWSRLKRLAGKGTSPWITLESAPTEAQAQKIAGQLEARGVRHAKVVKSKSGSYEVKVLREGARALARREHGSTPSSSSRTKGVTYKGVKIVERGGGFVAPGVDKDTVFDSLEDAKEFVGAQRNPSSTLHTYHEIGYYEPTEYSEKHPSGSKYVKLKNIYGMTDQEAWDEARAMAKERKGSVVLVGGGSPITVADLSRRNPESNTVLLCSNEDGNQLYFVGGDQSLDLKSIKMDGKWERDSMVIGVLYEVTYRTEKKFDKFKLTDYYHRLGEETKEEPTLRYDKLNCKMYIDGGQYKIKKPLIGMSPGIEN